MNQPFTFLGILSATLLVLTKATLKIDTPDHGKNLRELKNKGGGGSGMYYKECSDTLFSSDCGDGLVCLKFRNVPNIDGTPRGPECCNSLCPGFTAAFDPDGNRNPTKPNGAPCLGPDECLSGFCAPDGVCSCRPATSNNPPYSNVLPGVSTTCLPVEERSGSSSGEGGRFNFGPVEVGGCCTRSTDCAEITQGSGDGGCCRKHPGEVARRSDCTVGICGERTYPTYPCEGDPLLIDSFV